MKSVRPKLWLTGVFIVVAAASGLLLFNVTARSEDVVEVREGEPATLAAQALLRSSADTQMVLREVGKLPVLKTEDLLRVIDAMRAEVRAERDAWAMWATDDADRYPAWWVPRPAPAEALRSQTSIVVELRLVQPGSTDLGLSSTEGGCGVRAFGESAAALLTQFRAKGASVWLAPSVDLHPGQTVRFTSGWTRAFGGDAFDGIGVVDSRMFEGLELGLGVEATPRDSGGLTLSLGIKGSALRRPVSLVEDGDGVFQAAETVSSTPRMQRLTLEGRERSWLVRVDAPASSSASYFFLITARVKT